MKEGGVVAVYRFHKKADFIMPSTPSFLLTLDRLALSEKVHCPCYRLSVMVYVSNRNLRSCLNFGGSCQRLQSGLPPVCITCDGADNGEDCPGPVK